ncbi:MAG: tautomerase family protein [Proteobacteria bacterium]|nr:tautomerase family protein [Pseudomonadota bacterium]
MPMTRISLRRGKSPDFHKTLMDQIYHAMRESISIPENDRFATITEHDESGFNTSGDYGGIARTDDLVMIQIILNKGRSVEQKKSLYAAIVDRLTDSPGLQREDILINLVEVATEDWSLGNGEATYA